MPLIVWYKGGSKAAEVFEEANRWSWGSFSLKLYGPGEPAARETPLIEIDGSEIARVQPVGTSVRRFEGAKDAVFGDQ